GKFLSGIRMSTLLGQAGTYHRFVAAHQPKAAYGKQPKQPLPAFAFVTELRDAEGFSKGVSTVLRGAALLALTQVKIKIVEEKHNGCDLVGWRFDEEAPFKRDVNDIRFNFSPCFATVGNQFFAASTLELGREMIDLLKKEEHDRGDPPTSR